MIKTFCIISLISLSVLLASCDLRSGIAKENMEKWDATPTPTIVPVPTATPVDPADAVQVDTSQTGAPITINSFNEKKTAACKEFNRLTVNGSGNQITVTGACKQIALNGDKNTIIADAAVEIVLIGSENVVRYSRFANGKQPVINGDQAGNTVEHVAAAPTTIPNRKNAAK